jgi:YesN/AraC family two-component response regulator
MAKILLIEDEPGVRETLAAAVESKGHTAVVATNGREGLEKYGQDAFDLVITDIIMPEKEGIETIKELRKLNPNVKIVAISGGGRTGNMDFLKIAKSLGAMQTITKPIRLKAFNDILNECLGAK